MSFIDLFTNSIVSNVSQVTLLSEGFRRGEITTPWSSLSEILVIVTGQGERLTQLETKEVAAELDRNEIRSMTMSMTNRMQYIVEGEMTEQGLLFATGSGSWIQGSFGLPILRSSIIKGYMAISSNLDDSTNPVSVTIPIVFYDINGNKQPLNYSVHLSQIGNRLYGQQSLSLTLPKTSSEGGSILSFDPYMAVGEIKLDTRFRIVFEVETLEQGFSTYIP